MQINYDGGHYVTGIIHVAAGGAKTYDIRKIRDEQKPDVNGRPLPSDLKIAQVKWSVRGKVRLNGRTEMVSVRDRVSSSYSCFTCCPDSTGGFITPFQSVPVSPGATVGFIAMEQPYNTGGQSCGGPREPYPTSGIWESDTESVATVDNSGLATAIGAGFASISCYWTGFVYVWDDIDESCDVSEVTNEPSAGMPVELPISVTIESLTFSPGMIQMLNGSTAASINVSTSQFPKDANGNEIPLYVNVSLIRTGTEDVKGNMTASPQTMKLLVDGGSVNIPFGNLSTAANNNYCGTVGFKAVITDVTDANGTSYTGSNTYPKNVMTGPAGGRPQNLNVNCPTPAPQIISLSRISGPVGAQVTINGMNFGAQQGSSIASFNGVAANATSWSNTSINVTVPGGATTGPVVVVVSSQQSNPIQFTVQ